MPALSLKEQLAVTEYHLRSRTYLFYSDIYNNYLHFTKEETSSKSLSTMCVNTWNTTHLGTVQTVTILIIIIFHHHYHHYHHHHQEVEIMCFIFTYGPVNYNFFPITNDAHSPSLHTSASTGLWSQWQPMRCALEEDSGLCGNLGKGFKITVPKAPFFNMLSQNLPRISHTSGW